MNIFVIDPTDFQVNVEMLDDRRLVKMVLETAQLLSTAITCLGGTATYKPTHINHPDSIWTRANRANYKWLLTYFVAINDEYTYRYEREHKCLSLLHEFESHIDIFPYAEQIDEHPNCTPFKELPVYEAYRINMISKWKADKWPPKWTNRNPPEWYTNA